MKKYRALNLALSAILTGFFLFNVAVAGATAPVNHVASSTSQSDACSGLSQLDSSETCSKSGTAVNTTLSDIVNLLSILIGAVAVIMILVAGFRYITSGGEPEKVSGAKRALIYSLIGLVVAALAQLMVHLVLYQTNKIS